MPVVDYDFAQALAGADEARQRLLALGLSEFGERSHAWRFLLAAGRTIAKGVEPDQAESFLAAAYEAWKDAALDRTPPKDLILLGRRRGDVVAVTPGTPGSSPILVIDGIDRQRAAVAARARADTVALEPPVNRAADVASYLRRHFPSTVQRASDYAVRYETDGIEVVFDPHAPTLADALGPGLRDFVALVLRYRGRFYRGAAEPTLQRLSMVRLKWLPDLSIRLGEVSVPDARFAARGVYWATSAGAMLLAHAGLEGDPRVIFAIAEALGQALGGGTALVEPLLAFASQLGDPLAAGLEDFAQVLDVPPEEIRAVLGNARASVATLLKTLRPFVALEAGKEAARAFIVGAGLANEEQALAALRGLMPALRYAPYELLARCREAPDVALAAVSLGVDLAALNQILDDLGPPYARIDLTERHAASLAFFLDHRADLISEGIRKAHRAAFERGDNLTSYVAARNAPRPVLPEGYGQRFVDLPVEQMGDWLAAWLDQWHAVLPEGSPHAKDGLAAVRDANHRFLRELAGTVRVAILCRLKNGDPLRDAYASIVSAETALLTTASQQGWSDFDRLDDRAALAWAARSGLWPLEWPTSLQELAISEQERFDANKRDERARAEARARPRLMPYRGGAFAPESDSYAELAIKVQDMVAGNATLLATSGRVLKGLAPIGGRGGGLGGGGHLSGGGRPPRPPEDERRFTGFMGEVIAFEWLKRRYGESRLVDFSCWQSEYRRLLNDGGSGNDGLGYDFAIKNGGTSWFYEVKSTSLRDPGSKPVIELGSSEISQASRCRAEQRHRFRILYVTDALDPSCARIYVLPNPLSEAGERFFADSHSTGVRLAFSLSEAQ